MISGPATAWVCLLRLIAFIIVAAVALVGAILAAQTGKRAERLSIAFDFNERVEPWVSYDYRGGNGQSRFISLGLQNGWAFSYDEAWDVDTPEWSRAPGREHVRDSLVAVLLVRHLPSDPDAIDITGAIMSVDLDLSQLQINGGYVDFWFTTEQGRFHVDVPLKHGRNSVPMKNIVQSWARNNGPMDQVPNLTAVDSFGFAINGYLAEPTGKFLFDNFVLEVPAAGTS